MRFIVDAQLPPALARHLRTLGHDADHVLQLGLEGAADRDIWEAAVKQSAIVITKDEDFRTRRMAEQGPTIIWVRIGNTTIPFLLDALTRAWALIVDALDRGEPVVEVT